MDKLANYGSDDEYEDSPKYKRTEYRSSTEKPRQAASEADVNYEEVQMDLSEDSNSDSSKGEAQTPKNERYKNSKDNDDYDRKRAPEKSSHGDDKYGRDRERPKSRDEEDDRYRNRDDRREDRREDRDRNRDRNRDYKSKDSRYRDDRRSRRSSSRERRSRSPRRPSYRGKRSTSRERERDSKSSGYSRRYDRTSNKMAHLEKLDLQRSVDEEKRKTGAGKDRFFMPGITGRFREQIERRKLLWQKKEPEKEANTAAPASGTSAGRVWQTTTFAQDSDGKVASKFKRLMGIRESKEEAKPTTTDILKKQEEMFSSMEQQYEVARTATHTMRGVGLGFGSFQR